MAGLALGAFTGIAKKEKVSIIIGIVGIVFLLLGFGFSSGKPSACKRRGCKKA